MKRFISAFNQQIAESQKRCETGLRLLLIQASITNVKFGMTLLLHEIVGDYMLAK